MNSEEKIFYAVKRNEEQMIDFLKRLIRFNSAVIEHGLDGREGPLQQWLAEQLKNMGLEVDVFEPDNEKIKKYKGYSEGQSFKNRPNVVGVLKGKGGGRSIILNGHVDTIEPQKPELWKYPPFEAKIDKGKIYGLGAADMKSGLAAMVGAVKSLIDTKLEIKGDVILECVCGEEGGGNGTLACIERGYRADAAIVGEPSSLMIQPAARGEFLMEIKVTGRAIHATEKWRGVNAIEKIKIIMDKLSELERIWMGEKKNSLGLERTITYGKIVGGITANTLAEDCFLYVDVTYPPTELDFDGQENLVTPEEVREEIKKWIFTISQGDPWLKDHPPSIRIYQDAACFKTDENHPIVKLLFDCAKKVIPDPRISGARSGSDARHLVNILGIPTVVFGPANLWQAHSINEYVDINRYISAIKILALTIWRWISEKR